MSNPETKTTLADVQCYDTEPAGEDLANRFTYHPPVDETQTARYTFLRDQAKELATSIVACTPESREQALALTNLEQSIMWANAAIARNEA